MFDGGRMMASTLLAGAAAVFPACTATTVRLHALRARMHCDTGALWAATAMRGKFGLESET